MTRVITLDKQPIEVPAALADYFDRQIEHVALLSRQILDLEAAMRPPHKRRKPTRVGRRQT